MRDSVSTLGAAVSRSAYFDDAAECVRFWVLIAGEPVAASISRQTLHYRYCPHARSEDHLRTYEAHAADIGAAVRRRIAQGATEPVIVREPDLHGMLV